MDDQIEDLTEGSVDSTFLLSEPEIAETRNGDPYLRGTIEDRTGRMDIKKWDTPTAPEPGLYQVRGTVESYKGTLQVKADSLTETDGDIEKYVQCSTLGKEWLEDELDRLLENLQGEIGKVTRQIFSDPLVREKFLSHPAATKNHHAHRRGLAEHTISMCRIAEDLSQHYFDLYEEKQVGRDLLIAGCLLHDLGKIEELEADGPAYEYGLEGKLVGHVSVCVRMIHDAAAACLVNGPTKRRLTHMVVSHHGKPEWGAPVEPKLIEAVLLHQIDMLDSRMGMVRAAVDGLAEGDGQWVKALGREMVK